MADLTYQTRVLELQFGRVTDQLRRAGYPVRDLVEVHISSLGWYAEYIGRDGLAHLVHRSWDDKDDDG